MNSNEISCQNDVMCVESNLKVNKWFKTLIENSSQKFCLRVKLKG